MLEKNTDRATNSTKVELYEQNFCVLCQDNVSIMLIMKLHNYRKHETSWSCPEGENPRSSTNSCFFLSEHSTTSRDNILLLAKQSECCLVVSLLKATNQRWHLPQSTKHSISCSTTCYLSPETMKYQLFQVTRFTIVMWFLTCHSERRHSAWWVFLSVNNVTRNVVIMQSKWYEGRKAMQWKRL